MTVTVLQTEKLLQGNQSFSQLGFAMLLTRLKTLYAKNPTPATLDNCAKEINTFLGRFGNIMNADFAIISEL